ncbi:MAG: hypothetical protein PHY02_09785 [Phycisphaerae bacterium]|nr:hypothetical protein [Phycisphaerae bacterium]
MILTKPGKLCVAQEFSYATGAEDSENKLNIGTVEDVPDGTWIDIENAAAPAGTGALTINLVVALEATLDNVISVLQVVIAAVTDKRIATKGAHILGCSLPREVRELAEQLGYDYIGLIVTPTSSLVVSLNAAISPSQPRTRDKAQTVESNVGVPTQASAGS